MNKNIVEGTRLLRLPVPSEAADEIESNLMNGLDT